MRRAVFEGCTKMGVWEIGFAPARVSHDRIIFRTAFKTFPADRNKRRRGYGRKSARIAAAFPSARARWLSVFFTADERWPNVSEWPSGMNIAS